MVVGRDLKLFIRMHIRIYNSLSNPLIIPETTLRTDSPMSLVPVFELCSQRIL